MKDKKVNITLAEQFVKEVEENARSNMTLAEEFLNELKQHDSEGKLLIKIFNETILKYGGIKNELGFEFKDKSQTYYNSDTSDWICI